ncbi:MAG: hypothetical protein KJ587_13740 [Alphaproteobacteria bacterium]|nr:hypothetical protein [Alphaproteobacteria bacterium]
MKNEEKQTMDLLQRTGLDQLETDMIGDVERARTLMVQTESAEELDAVRLLLNVQHGILDALALVKGRMALSAVQTTLQEPDIRQI